MLSNDVERSDTALKCPNTEFFLVHIFCIWTESGDLLRKSLYSVQIQENTDQEKLCIWTLFTQCDDSHRDSNL